MENDELIFVLNTAELKDGGFEGSFNDMASEFEDSGAVVSGDYDEDGTPIMTVFGISTEEINDILSSYGVENPEEYTAEVESAENMDFDEEEGNVEADDDEVVEIADDDDDDDEVIEIVDDEEEVMEEHTVIRRARPVMEHRHRPSMRPRQRSRKTVDEKPKGTQNLSESVTNKILAQVKDVAMMNRILERYEFYANVEADCEAYTPNIPYAGIKVNGKEIIYESVDTLQNMLNETKSNYKKYYKGYKSLNESEGEQSLKYKKVLKKQHSLIQILENVLEFKGGRLMEDEMMGDADNATSTEDTNPSNELGDQTATLTSIVFKVKDADAFIKTLVDNGIPEEALEKTASDDAAAGSDAQPEEQPQQNQMMGGAPDAGGMGAMGGAPDAGGMGGGNPFESLTTRLTSRLNEDENGGENPFAEPDQPASDSGVDPLSTESNDNAESGEEVRLIDTSYASKVQQILQDVYGYSKEQFEDKLGGQIEAEGQEMGDGSDGESDEWADDENSEKDGEEEEIKPEDIFGDL